MLVSEALSCLGSNRTIWIDDLFAESPADLADMLLQNRETALKCKISELDAILRRAEFGDEPARADLVEKLLELSSERRGEIKSTFFTNESENKFASDELPHESVEKICGILGVQGIDRWTFDAATSAVLKLCAEGDANISYIVDLNESGGSATRGLDILKILWEGRSKGTAFILTHEAAVTTEGIKENELRDLLIRESDGAFGIPICVIAKERLFDVADSVDLEENLKTSIKRAGLRRSLSEVVSRAQDTVQVAFRTAAGRLLSVPPEQLEAHVFERGYKEGVSELHVVERALTSHISQELRHFFGVDKEVLASTRRLRSLRSIQLMNLDSTPDPNLALFRLAEVWESHELINRALAPLACGDVFEPDPYEKSVKNLSRKFILLAQPCDIALRPSGKERNHETAFLVPLIKQKGESVSEEDAKRPVLPCKLGDDYWACDFRNATSVRLAVLDLASFRMDGRVRVDEGHVPAPDLFAAQSRIYERRTAPSTKALEAGSLTAANKESVELAFQLSFSSKGSFSHFHWGNFEDEIAENKSAKVPALPKRITWRLRRCGRVRMPYSAALLDQYLDIMNRQAFDLDYMTPGISDGKPPEES